MRATTAHPSVSSAASVRRPGVPLRYCAAPSGTLLIWKEGLDVIAPTKGREMFAFRYLMMIGLALFLFLVGVALVVVVDEKPKHSLNL